MVKNYYTSRCDAMIKRFTFLPKRDVFIVGLYCTEEPEDISPLTEQERAVLFDGDRKRLYGYCASAVELRGSVDLKKFIVNYNALINELPLLRTTYITDEISQPVRVLNAKSPKVFPIFTLVSTPCAKQREVIANAVNDETTRLYRPHCDGLIQLRGYLTENDRMTVIVSIRAASGLSLSAEDIVKRVFTGMSIEGISSFEQINAAKFADEVAPVTVNLADYIAMNSIFAGCAEAEIARLTRRSRLETYDCDSIISEERRAVGELAVIISGMVEESKIGAGSIVKSVCVRKAGEAFSVEALLDNNESVFTYSAMENGTQVLWINREDFIRAANACPQIWLALLEQVHIQEEKIKRLWTIL